MQEKTSKYSLIQETSSVIEAGNELFETIQQVFVEAEHITVLYEGAETYIGNAIASLNAGKNPLEDEMSMVNPSILAALVLLADPANRQAFNFSPAKFAVLDHVDKSKNVRKFLSDKVGMSGSGRKAQERLKAMASENPKALERELRKAQMQYSQASDQQARIAA